jgi:hypothetical protein
MESSGGWQFWLEDQGRVRHFVVAESEEIEARTLLRKKLQHENILSRKMVPQAVIQMLKMKPGELCEWVAAEAESPITPQATPV